MSIDNLIKFANMILHESPDHIYGNSRILIFLISEAPELFCSVLLSKIWSSSLLLKQPYYPI